MNHVTGGIVPNTVYTIITKYRGNMLLLYMALTPRLNPADLSLCQASESAVSGKKCGIWRAILQLYSAF